LDINHPEDVKIILSQVNYLTSPNSYKTLFLDNTFSNEEEIVRKEDIIEQKNILGRVYKFSLFCLD